MTDQTVRDFELLAKHYREDAKTSTNAVRVACYDRFARELEIALEREQQRAKLRDGRVSPDSLPPHTRRERSQV